jgi:hypothetical protein
MMRSRTRDFGTEEITSFSTATCVFLGLFITISA